MFVCLHFMILDIDEFLVKTMYIIQYVKQFYTLVDSSSNYSFFTTWAPYMNLSFINFSPLTCVTISPAL